MIQSIQMVPSGIKIGNQQSKVSVYADDIVLIGKKWNRNNTTFCRNRKHCHKVKTTYEPRKNKIYDSGMENSSKQNKTGQLTIKNYIFEGDEYFKYLGVTCNDDDNHQTDL